MAETPTIPRTKLAVSRPRILADAHSAEELTVQFTEKKSPPSGELTVSASSYEAILAEMRPVHNEDTGTENRFRKNEARAELADAQEIVRRVGGRPSSQKPEKRRKGGRGQWSSERDQATQKRRAQARDEPQKTSKEENEEPELGRLEFARILRNNPAQLTHLRRVLPAWDYRQLEARLVFWEKFEEREKNLASLAQQAAVAHASAQEKWDLARELIAQSLMPIPSPREYSLGEQTEIIREVIKAAKESQAREKDYLRARRLHLATMFEEPSDPEPQNVPEKPDKQKSPMFGLAVRLNTDTDKIAKQLYAIAQR